jgi:hypothetical protein
MVLRLFRLLPALLIGSMATLGLDIGALGAPRSDANSAL